MKFVQKLKKIT